MNIECIEDLVEVLNKTEISNFPSVLKSIDIPEAQLSECASWDSQNYTRNCIERNDRYELLLLCWKPWHETPIHGHDGQKCWVYQLSGKVTEKRYKTSEKGPVETSSQILTPGKLTYMDDKMGFHVLSNPNNSRAMSLHLYVSPIDQCRVFNKIRQEFEMKDLAYDQIVKMEHESA